MKSPVKPSYFKTFVAFILAFATQGYAQDCLKDTVPPVLSCLDTLVMNHPLCGNIQYFPSEFFYKVQDDCPVSSAFDKDFQIPYYEYMDFISKYGYENDVEIFVKDLAGNQSRCFSHFYFSNKKFHSAINIGISLYSDYWEGDDLKKFNVGIKSKAGHVYKASLQDAGSLHIPVNDYVDLDSLLLGTDSYQTGPRRILSTADAFRIVKHIVGYYDLRKTAHAIAADWNQDGVIDLRDVKGLRDFIPGGYDSLRSFFALFVDDQGKPIGKTMLFDPNPSTVYNIWLDERGNINNRFPIQMGTSNEAVPQFGGSPINWLVEDVVCRKGQHYTVKFRFNDSTDLYGVQTAFAYASNKITVDQVKSEQYNTGNMFYQILPNMVRTLFWNVSDPNKTDEFPLLQFEITALVDCKLSEVFTVAKTGMASFSIKTNDEVHPAALKFHTIKTTPGDVWMGNRLNLFPNPTEGRVYIEHGIPGNESVEWQLFDLNMRMVAQDKLDGTLTCVDFPTSLHGEFWLVLMEAGQMKEKHLLIIE